MPFDPVDGMDFAQVKEGLEHYIHYAEILKGLDLLPDYKGKKASQYFMAGMTMVEVAADKLYANDHANTVLIEQLRTDLDKLRSDFEGLRLADGRLQEAVDTVQAKDAES